MLGASELGLLATRELLLQFLRPPQRTQVPSFCSIEWLQGARCCPRGEQRLGGTAWLCRAPGPQWGLLWQMLPAWERALAFVSTEDFLPCSALVLILMKY